MIHAFFSHSSILSLLLSRKSISSNPFIKQCYLSALISTCSLLPVALLVLVCSGRFTSSSIFGSASIESNNSCRNSSVTVSYTHLGCHCTDYHLCRPDVQQHHSSGSSTSASRQSGEPDCRSVSYTHLKWHRSRGTEQQ